MNTTKIEELKAAYQDKLESVRESATLAMVERRLRSSAAIDDNLKRESISTLTTILKDVNELLGLDADKLSMSIKGARKSEYGRIPEMVTALTKMYAWPIESIDDVKEIDEKQEEIRELLASKGIVLSHDLLLDIKEAKGYHSFLDKDTFEIIDGVEPEYEEFNYYITTAAEAMDLPYVDFKLQEAKWEKNEDKALAKIKIEHEAAQAALDAHKKLMNS